MGYPWGEDPENLPDPDDIVDMSDDDLADLEPPLIRDPNGDIRPMTEDEKNEHDAEVLGLSPDEWAKIAEVFDAGMLALDVIAVLGVIFPEVGTSVAGTLWQFALDDQPSVKHLNLKHLNLIIPLKMFLKMKYQIG